MCSTFSSEMSITNWAMMCSSSLMPAHYGASQSTSTTKVHISTVEEELEDRQSSSDSATPSDKGSVLSKLYEAVAKLTWRWTFCILRLWWWTFVHVPLLHLEQNQCHFCFRCFWGFERSVTIILGQNVSVFEANKHLVQSFIQWPCWKFIQRLLPLLAPLWLLWLPLLHCQGQYLHQHCNQYYHGYCYHCHQRLMKYIIMSKLRVPTIPVGCCCISSVVGMIVANVSNSIRANNSSVEGEEKNS